MFRKITFGEFHEATADAIVIRGGEMLDEGSYSEYDANGGLYRYERDAEGNQAWYVFEPSSAPTDRRSPMQRALANEHALRERDHNGGVL